MAGIIRNHTRKLIAGGVLIGGFVFFPYTGLPNPFRTTGVENIEKRYSSGGGSKNHLPATATKRGDHDHVEGNTETAKGIGSPHHQEHFGGQKPDPSSFDKTWNQAQYRSDKGK